MSFAFHRNEPPACATKHCGLRCSHADVWNLSSAERKLDDFAAEHGFELCMGFKYGGMHDGVWRVEDHPHPQSSRFESLLGLTRHVGYCEGRSG